MKQLKLILLFVGCLIIAGCATQKNIQLSDNFFQDRKQRIAIVGTVTPSPQFYRVGGQGLIDYAINNSLNRDLDRHLAKLDVSWYRHWPIAFADELKKRNMNVKAFTGKINANAKSYTTFAIQSGSDRLLVLRLEAIGAIRSYSGFIPIDTPQGYCAITGELINTRDNRVLWRHNATIRQPIVGPWDQPPFYPNLTVAVERAVASAREEVLDSFFSGH